MSRVWKRFFYKLMQGLSAIAYILSAIVLPSIAAHWAGFDPEVGMAVGAVTFIVLPMIVFLIRDLYRDAKREVEWENRDMMRALKGNDYD